MADMIDQKCFGCGTVYKVASNFSTSKCWTCGMVEEVERLRQYFDAAHPLRALPVAGPNDSPGTVILDIEGNKRRQGEAIRTFDTGATRDIDKGKPDLEGFLSPLVLEAFAIYMDINRTQADGTERASDNWQKGIPPQAYIKSGWRHFFDWWSTYRTLTRGGSIPKGAMFAATCGLMFNVMGYLHETLKTNENNDWLAEEANAYAKTRADELANRRAGK